MSKTVVTVALVVSWLAATNAFAQWTVTRLAPEGETESIAVAVRDGQVGGAVAFDVGGGGHAGFWGNFTADSFTDLSPSPVQENWRVNGVEGGQQAGYAFIGDMFRASIWNGTPDSRVDLHPLNSEGSFVTGVGGGAQAGTAVFDNGKARASLWHGTADSWVNLHPGETVESEARATDGVQTVGFVQRNLQEAFHAALWNGTNDWIDLNPSGSTQSQAEAVENGFQAGEATFGGVSHAGMWHGTADSWIDMNPSGAVWSGLFGMSGNWQAGWASYHPQALFRHAGVWAGTASSFEDLHAELPGNWTYSFAQGIWSDGSTIWVAGWGEEAGKTREALLWSRPVPEPSGLALAGLAVAALLPLWVRRQTLRGT